jgi:ABC-type sugar transport system ATPase subunit
MKNISKSFPGVLALDGVSFGIRKGEIHALLGENGAGKSTLMKILCGIYKADTGEIYVNSEKVDIHDVLSASKIGISIVHQELCLANNLSVAENIFVGRVPVKKPFNTMDRKTMNKMAAQICAEYGLDLDPDTNLGELTIAQQQMVELAKAMSQDAQIIILDEPTGPLTDQEIEKLFEAIASLKAKGVAFIYVSHKLEEIFKIADRATVLRDGKYIATKDVEELDYHQLVRLLIGREMSEMYDPPNATIGNKALEVKHVNIQNKVLDASLYVREGEVLGLYGLIGAGRTELMRGICGIDTIDSGEIYINDKRVIIDGPFRAIENGIFLLPEDRKTQGLVLMNSVAFNVTIGVWEQIISGIRVNKKLENEIIQTYVDKLEIKTPDIETWVGSLSGGNQQKVVVAKALATQPKILIMDEPTRGIDVGAKKEIYKIIHDLANEGVAIILVSSELPELINMSNRVVVLHEGRITGELSGSEICEERIIICATGGNKTSHEQ